MSSCTCVLLRLIVSGPGSGLRRLGPGSGLRRLSPGSGLVGLRRLSPAPVSGRLELTVVLQRGSAPVRRRRRLRCCGEARRRIPLVFPRHDWHSAARVLDRFRSAFLQPHKHKHVLLCYTRACAFILRHFRTRADARWRCTSLTASRKHILRPNVQTMHPKFYVILVIFNTI